MRHGQTFEVGRAIGGPAQGEFRTGARGGDPVLDSRSVHTSAYGCSAANRTPSRPVGHTQRVDRNFSPWTYWLARQDEIRPLDPVPDDPGAMPAWRDRVRVRLAERLGPWPDPVPPRVEFGDPVEEEGLLRQRVVFDTEAHLSVPAWLLTPVGLRPPGAAVLVVHGHGQDKDVVCGAAPATTSPSPGSDYARVIARSGLVVLAPDLRGFGERADRLLPVPDPGDLAAEIVAHQADCGWELTCALLTGTTPLAQNLWDLRRCLDVLARLPQVDERRIGAAGWSYGGALVLFLAAVDPRVRAVVVSGFLSSWRRAHRVPWNLCGRQILAGLLGNLEHVDLASLVAPRPLLVESGRDDPLFPAEEAAATVAALRHIYRGLGADAAAVHHDVFDGGHRFWGKRSVPFLSEQLRRP